MSEGAGPARRRRRGRPAGRPAAAAGPARGGRGAAATVSRTRCGPSSRRRRCGSPGATPAGGRHAARSAGWPTVADRHVGLRARAGAARPASGWREATSTAAGARPRPRLAGSPSRHGYAYSKALAAAVDGATCPLAMRPIDGDRRAAGDRAPACSPRSACRTRRPGAARPGPARCADSAGARAVAEAEAALATFERIGATVDADAAAALLRSLGVTPRAGRARCRRPDRSGTPDRWNWSARV